MTKLIDYAKSHLNIPYIWGGENPLQGFDCSGFIQWLFRSVGIDPKGDQSSQALYDWCLLKGFSPDRKAGALAFYGKEANKIYHIAMFVNEMQVIEAAGGDSTTTTYQAAIERGACVRLRPFDHRKDLVGIFMPEYPDWVKNG